MKTKMALDKEMIIKESAAIHRFFDHMRSRVLSVSAIEHFAEAPKNTLLNLLTTERPIPANHIVNLVHVLEKFGYQAQWDWSSLGSQHNANSLITDPDKKHNQEGIYFYYNYPNRKVTLHKGRCSFCNGGKGAQTTKLGEANGAWQGPFDTYQSALAEAQVIAQKLNTSPTTCRRCNPQNE
ncbi:hypothetical protein [Spirosoma koreense]